MHASAHTIRTTLLDPAMDARAHSIGVAQHLRALAEPLRLLAASASPVQQPALLAVFSSVREIHAHNAKMGELHRDIAGAADQLAATARGAETARDAQAALGVQAIARRLRGPLGVLDGSQHRSARELTEAAWVVRDVARTVPRERLLSAAVRHELGMRKFTTLVRLLEDPLEIAA